MGKLVYMYLSVFPILLKSYEIENGIFANAKYYEESLDFLNYYIQTKWQKQWQQKKMGRTIIGQLWNTLEMIY